MKIMAMGNESKIVRVNVYYSDFKDVPGLKNRFWNLAQGSRCLRIIRFCDRFVEVEGLSIFVEGLYNG